MNQRIQGFVALSLAHFANDGNGYVLITLYPILFPLAYYTFGGGSKLSSLLIIGILAALVNSFSVAASPLVGRIADKTRRYDALIALGLFLMGVGIAGYALAVLFASGALLFFVLIPFTIVAGVGSAFYHPLGGSALSEIWPRESIGRALGINGSSGSTGRALYPILVATLVAYLTTPSVIVLAVLSFVISLFVLTSLKKINIGVPRQKGKVEEKVKMKPVSTSPPISLAVVFKSTLALTIGAFMRGIFSVGVVSFVPVYLERVSGISYGIGLGLAFSLILALPVPAQFVFGSIADRFGRRLALGITTVGSAGSILLLLLTQNAFIQIALFSLFAFFAFTQFPLLMPLARNAVPKEAATMSNSIVWGIGNSGGGAFGPFLVGLLAAPSFLGSLNGAFAIIALICLLSVATMPFIRSAPTKALERRHIATF
jgi:FSR family fosmidomycin resistance protein-like MFS transporter